jgi:exonuclease VII large subunit
MKRTGYIAAGILLALGTMAASAQSLGDYARSIRKTHAPSQAKANHHYENEDLPRDTQVSVVGPAPSGNASDQAAKPDVAGTPSANASTDSAKNPNDAKMAADDKKKAADDMRKKIDDQKQKVDALSHELDLTQREYKLRAASFYADAGARLRNAAQWDKDDAQYQQSIADKQKALEAARTELEADQEAARKAGVRQKDDQ